MADFSFDHQQSGEWASENFFPITDLSQLFEISCHDSMNIHQAEVEKIEDLFSNLSNVELRSEHEQPALPPPTTEVIWTTETGEPSWAQAHQWNAILHSHQMSKEQMEWEEETNLKTHDLSQRVIDLADSEEEEEEEEEKQEPNVQQKKRRKKRMNEAHNISEKKRRDRFAEKIRALQEVVPNCRKRDIASVLEDAAEYGKLLQQQFQTMYMHQCMQAQCYSPFVPMIRPMMGMGMMYNSGYPANFQTVPTFGLNSPGYQSGFQPAASQSQFPFMERR